MDEFGCIKSIVTCIHLHKPCIAVNVCRECDFERDIRIACCPFTVSLATAIRVITAIAVLHNINFVKIGFSLVDIQQGEDDQVDEGRFPVDVQDPMDSISTNVNQRQVLGWPNKFKFGFRVLNRE